MIRFDGHSKCWLFSCLLQVFVSHCSAGVDMVPSQYMTLDPSVSANISFTLHSFHAVGRINHCEGV